MVRPRIPTLSLAVLLCLVVVSTASAQLTISPNGILLKPDRRTGEVDVKNPTDKPMAVTARLIYAVLRTDSTGSTYKDTVLSGRPGERPAVSWMRAFPRQFTLAPGASRSVKVMANPPADLADGEWISRLEIKGVPVDKPKEIEDDTTKIGVTLNYTYSYNFPAVYHKGTLTTGIDFDQVGARIDDKGATLQLRLSVAGNSTYRGTFFVTLTPVGGGEPRTFESPVIATVGYDYPLPLPALSRGSYLVSVNAATRKRGGETEYLVTAPDVKKEFIIDVAERAISVATR